MKGKYLHFAAGLMVGAALFGGGTALAAGILAEPSEQTFYLDDRQIQLEAYAIAGHNYVQLRDVGRAVGFNVTYDGARNAVVIDPDAPYSGDTSAATPTASPGAQVQPDGSGAFSPTPFTCKTLTGDDRAREDFSQQANPAIFTGHLTRAAYNAARQSILDRDAIIAGNDAEGFNPCYAYAYTTATAETGREMNRALSRIGSYFWYSITAEPYLQFYYNYPDYFIVAPSVLETSIEAESYTDALIAEAAILPTDTDKVRLFNDHLCDRMEFNSKASASLTEIFDSAGPKVTGKCTTFADAFQYLCDRAGIPCIKISSEDHTWNAVYADGHVLHGNRADHTEPTSITNMLLTEISRKTDANPEMTLFTKELLVPGSTT